jgi:hypothetical protein
MGTTREFTTPLKYRARRRVGYTHERGEVVRFIVRLEYRVGGAWMEVVQFDHDPESDHAHGVTEEGVHMDIYRSDKKIRSEQAFPPMKASDTLTLAEEHLNQHAERYLNRFEEWHEIRNR